MCKLRCFPSADWKSDSPKPLGGPCFDQSPPHWQQGLSVAFLLFRITRGTAGSAYLRQNGLGLAVWIGSGMSIYLLETYTNSS